MSRSPKSLVVALCTALVASALLLAVPAQAAAARNVSIAATPNGALAGARVTFAGKLSTSPKGSAVRIQRKVGTTWKTAKATTTTNSAGRYSVRVALPSKVGAYLYRAYSPKFEGLKTATSTVITVKALRKTTFVLLGGTDVLYGHDGFGGAYANGTLKKTFTKGAAVTVQRKVAGTWTKVAAGTVGADGFFEIDFAEKDGTYRVVISRKGLNASVTSTVRKVTFG